MNLTNEQYERVARRLDGENVALDAQEHAAADELRRNERRVGALMDAAPPAGAIERACRHVLAAEARRDEAALAAALDADVPRETIDRAYRRVTAELARPQRRLMRIGEVAAALAVAAAVVLAVGLARLAVEPAGPPAPEPAMAGVPAEVLSASVDQPEDPAIRLLADEIDQLEADMLASTPPAPVDLGIDQLERAVAEFWLEDAPD